MYYFYSRACFYFSLLLRSITRWHLVHKHNTDILKQFKNKTQVLSNSDNNSSIFRLPDCWFVDECSYCLFTLKCFHSSHVPTNNDIVITEMSPWKAWGQPAKQPVRYDLTNQATGNTTHGLFNCVFRIMLVFRDYFNKYPSKQVRTTFAAWAQSPIELRWKKKYSKRLARARIQC